MKSHHTGLGREKQTCSELQIRCIHGIPKSLFLIQTLFNDHLLESSPKDDSNEWSQGRVWMRNKGKMQENASVTQAYLELW